MPTFSPGQSSPHPTSQPLIDHTQLPCPSPEPQTTCYSPANPSSSGHNQNLLLSDHLPTHSPTSTSDQSPPNSVQTFPEQPAIAPYTTLQNPHPPQPTHPMTTRAKSGIFKTNFGYHKDRQIGQKQNQPELRMPWQLLSGNMLWTLSIQPS